MFKKHKKGTLFVTAFLLFIFSVYGLTTFHNWRFSQKIGQYSFAGNVVEKKDESIVIRDVGGIDKTFPIDEGTEVYRGSQPVNISEIATNSFILVEVNPLNLQTLKIRLLKHAK